MISRAARGIKIIKVIKKFYKEQSRDTGIILENQWFDTLELFPYSGYLAFDLFQEE